jgi:hypothetical protein
VLAIAGARIVVVCKQQPGATVSIAVLPLLLQVIDFLSNT